MTGNALLKTFVFIGVPLISSNRIPVRMRHILMMVRPRSRTAREKMYENGHRGDNFTLADRGAVRVLSGLQAQRIHGKLLCLGPELMVVLAYYQQPPLKVVEASVWGIVTIWSGFLVLYTTDFRTGLPEYWASRSPAQFSRIARSCTRQTSPGACSGRRHRWLYWRVQWLCRLSGGDSRPD